MSLELWDEYRQNIEHSITNAPRSLQRTIGPSELGTPCLRCLGMKLIGVPKQAETKPHMYTFVGTCVHEHMERLFSSLDPERYKTEIRVTVARLPSTHNSETEEFDTTIKGSIDVYDTQANATIDWKVSSNDRIQTIKRQGLPQEYLIQASLYGIGVYDKDGLYDGNSPVIGKAYPSKSCVYFLPRNGQSLDSAYPIEWKYTIEPGMWALARAKQILNIFNAIKIMYGGKSAVAWVNSMPACGAESGECWDCMNSTYMPAELMSIKCHLPEPPKAYIGLYDSIQSHYTGEIPDYQTL